MSGFDAGWLALRAPHDAAARDTGLADAFAAAAGRPLRLVDIGAGTGANVRVLAAGLRGNQDWVLVDRDRALLDVALEETDAWARRKGWPVQREPGALKVVTHKEIFRLRTVELDLARRLDGLDLARCNGLTASAFMDLVSADWLDRLAARTAASNLPFYAALTFDGRVDWTPPDPDDTAVRDALCRHQRRDKGFGPALGPAAAGYMAERWGGHGYEVRAVESDWHLAVEDDALQSAYVAVQLAAALDDGTLAADRVQAWADRRRGHIAAGTSRLVVGHRDVLAIPR